MTFMRHGIVAVILITGYAHVWAGTRCEPPGDGAVEWKHDAGNQTIEFEIGNSTIWNYTEACETSIGGIGAEIHIAKLTIQKGLPLRLSLSEEWLQLGYHVHDVEDADVKKCSAVAAVGMETDLVNVTIVGYNSFIVVTSENRNRTYGVNVTVKDSACFTTDDDRVCSGHGACVTYHDQVDYRCHCCQGYHGDTCEYEDTPTDDVCDHTTCYNGGECISGNTKKSAAHQSELSMTKLQEGNQSLSDSRTSIGYRCLCRPFFTGERCEVRATACMSSPCVSGVCRETVDGYQCYCVPGFHGKRCELEYNECQSSPCRHGGTCVDRIDSYECVCPQGHRGSNCEVKIHLCNPNPCHANVSCTETNNRFHCQCPTNRVDSYSIILDTETVIKVYDHVVTTTTTTSPTPK